MFFPCSSLQSISSKKQTLNPDPNHIPSKANLSLQTHKFSWQTNTKNPTGKKKPQITTTELKNMKIKPKKKNRNLATKWQKLIISLVDNIFTPSKIFFYWSENFKFFKNISNAQREWARERERERLRNSVSECEWEMETREKPKENREKKRYNFFFFFFFLKQSKEKWR